MSDAPQTGPTFVPYFGYADAAAAMDFLERAFGFRRTTDYRGDDGSVMHGEMWFAGGTLMLGSAVHSAPVTGSGIYIHTSDVDALFAMAVEAGAAVVWEPHDTEFGTRRARVTDPEGYEWSFGSYLPTPPADT